MRIEISRPFKLNRNERFAYDFLKLVFIAGCIVIGLFIGAGLVAGYYKGIHALHP